MTLLKPTLIAPANGAEFSSDTTEAQLWSRNEGLTGTYRKTLRIYYSSLSSPHYIECPCIRWDTSDYSITIETILNKDDRNTLYNHITPGAVGELYKILGKPFYYDKTWEGNNTLRLVPISGTGLYNLRSEKIIYVKNYSETNLNPSWLGIKIEGYISGESL